MGLNKLKAALNAMGVICCEDEEISSIVDKFDKIYGITIYKLEVASVDISEIVEQIEREAKQSKLLCDAIVKQQKRKWFIPKKIGKPQKRKG